MMLERYPEAITAFDSVLEIDITNTYDDILIHILLPLQH